MAKSTKKRTTERVSSKSNATKRRKQTNSRAKQKSGGTPGTKQARVIAMLSSPNGTTVAEMMTATGWQQHSARGFLAGVVRKKLQRDLTSAVINGVRIYPHGEGRLV